MKKKTNDRIAHEIRIIDVAIKTSTRMYIFSERMKSSIWKILQLLPIRYKRFDREINLQLHEKFQRLKIASAKKNRIMNCELKKSEKHRYRKKTKDSLKFEKLFVQNFFKASRSWAFLFCDTWMQNKIAAEKFIKFFSIIRQYHVSIKTIMKKKHHTKKIMQLLCKMQFRRIRLLIKTKKTSNHFEKRIKKIWQKLKSW